MHCAIQGSHPRKKSIPEPDLQCAGMQSPQGGVGNVQPIWTASWTLAKDSAWLETWSLDDLRQWQQQDGLIQTLLHWKEKDGQKPKWGEVAGQTKLVKTLWAQWESLEVKDGILLRRWSPRPGTSHRIQQLVAPRQLQKEILEGLHSNRLGRHFGVRKTLVNIRHGFYWPGYSADVERWCQECWVCQRRTKGSTKRRGELRWHKERHHRMNKRDCTRGTPERVRGPPTPKDEFGTTPDIVFDSGECELYNYTQMGPHGLQAARDREKGNYRQRPRRGKRHQAQCHDPRETQRSELRPSCSLWVTARVLITIAY